MALFATSRAVSRAIKRNVDIAERKHVERLAELEQEFKLQRITREDRFGRKLYDQRIEHMQWQAGLQDVERKIYETCLEDLRAADKSNAPE